MCGIAGGVFSKNLSEKTIEEMTSSVSHRGPDAKGVLRFEGGAGFLGHCRLSVIDLNERANQPMSITRKDGSKVSISYNGEIYNYKEIKQELEGLGYAFNTSSDTEVVLRSFVEWGDTMLEKFRGMFAFALWDEKEEKLYLVRDRFGVKPLYYFSGREGLFFASELKALYKAPGFQKNIDKKALAYYLRFGFVPEPFTIFENVKKVGAGEMVTASKKEGEKSRKYWNAVDSFREIKDISEEKAEKEALRLLKESFLYRTVADVDVGLFLSGGTDSSLIAALLQKELNKSLKTFTIGFRGAEESEHKHAEQVAKKLDTEHKTVYIDSASMAALLPKMAKILDEPFGDSSAFPLYLLSKEARKDVKVVLSGDGGDELFYGYSKYLAIRKIHSLNPLSRMVLKAGSGILGNELVSRLFKKLFGRRFSNIDAKIKKLEKLLKTHGGLASMFSAASSYLTEKELEKLIGTKDKQLLSSRDNGLTAEQQMRLWDIEQYLPADILVKTDRVTMAAGLEAREPYLDESLLSFASGLPMRHLVQRGSQKHIFKRILLRYLPKELVERPKTGFRPPTWQWLSGELKEQADNLLGESYIREQGIFSEKEIAKIRENFNKNPKANADLLWNIFMFQVWYKTWVEEKEL